METPTTELDQSSYGILTSTHHDLKSVETRTKGDGDPHSSTSLIPASIPHPNPPSLPSTSTCTTRVNSSRPQPTVSSRQPMRDYAELRLNPATTTSVVTTTTTVTTHFAPIRIPKSRQTVVAPSSYYPYPPPTTVEQELGGEAGSEGGESSWRRLSEIHELVQREHSSPLELDPRTYPLSASDWTGPDFRGAKFKVELGQFVANFVEDAADESQSPSIKGKGKEGERDGGEESRGAELKKSERGPLQARRVSRRAGATRGFDAMEEETEGEEADTGRREASPGPPRKRPRSESNQEAPSISNSGTAGRRNSVINLQSLPSPNQGPPSPVPTSGGEDSQDVSFQEDEEVADPSTNVERSTDIAQAVGPQTFDLGQSPALSTLLSLPDLVETFDQLSPSLQSYLLFTLLKRSPVPVLQTVANVIAPALRRDFLTDLPPELSIQVLGYLDATTLCRSSLVCRGWRRLVDGEWRIWKKIMCDDGLWIGDGSEEREAREIMTGKKENWFLKRWKAGVWDEKKSSSWNGKVESDREFVEGYQHRRPSISVRLASPSSSRESSPSPVTNHLVHPYKTLYRRRWLTRKNWQFAEPKRTTFTSSTATTNVVTCLQFDEDKIVSASDDEDHSIHVFDTQSGSERAELRGHTGGVWALQYVGNVLVSGSTDRSVRVWDLETARCTHEFIGHTSTVRCLQIVEPRNVNPDPTGEPIWEPSVPLVVTGSRDWSLRVWKLPLAGRDRDYHPVVPMSPSEGTLEPTDNPYFVRALTGHRQAVRAVAAAGRIAVSGSYDHSVRVWDLVTGKCRFELTGHSQKVYSVVLDYDRKLCASGSMDGTVRLCNVETGECQAKLDGHSSLVGLLGLSHRCLVSAAADWSLRIWDPDTGECRHALNAHQGAITCFQHDEYKIVSGSDGTLKMWDTQSGEFIRDLLANLTGVWQVAFNQRYCVAAVQRNGSSEFELLDFGAVDRDEIKPDPPLHPRSRSPARVTIDLDLTGSTDSPRTSDVSMSDVPGRRASLPNSTTSSDPSAPAAGPPPTILRSAEFPRRRSSHASSSVGAAVVAPFSTPVNNTGSVQSTTTSTTAGRTRSVRRTDSSRNLTNRGGVSLSTASNETPTAGGSQGERNSMDVDDEQEETPSTGGGAIQWAEEEEEGDD